MATRSTKSTASPAPVKKKAAAKPVVPKKEAGGRPSKYTPKFHVPLARRLTLLGQTMAEMANVFEIAESTIWDWKNKHVEFSEAITCARDEADSLVSDALRISAIGQTVTETRIRTILSKTGEEVVEKTVITKQIPGDVGAQKHWLHNRQPAKWKAAPEDKSGAGDLPPITSINFVAVDASGDPDIDDDEDSDA